MISQQEIQELSEEYQQELQEQLDAYKESEEELA